MYNYYKSVNTECIIFVGLLKQQHITYIENISTIYCG